MPCLPVGILCYMCYIVMCVLCRVEGVDVDKVNRQDVAVGPGG